MTDYAPNTGEDVLLTVRATFDGNHFVVRDDDGDTRAKIVYGHSATVRIEPAPIPVPTDLGAVILAEVTDCSIPGRLMLVSGGSHPEDGYRWVHVDRPSDTYGPSEITRVHAVLLAGDPS